MKNRKFLYVYVNENNIIQEIKTSKNPHINFTEILVPFDNGKEFLELKEKWDNSYGYKEAHILLLDDGLYFLKKIIYVYYYKKNKNVKCISPILLSEYDKDISLSCGKAAVNSLIEDFINGTKTFSLYEIKEGKDLVEFIEMDINLIAKFNDIQLLKYYKINFIIKGPWIELRYNRKKKEMIIIRNSDLGVEELYFTKKNDRTILYNKLKVKYESLENKFKNVELPKEFDTYCLRKEIWEEQARFSYKEIK